MTYHQQRAWLWSRDCFKILPLVVMQRDARVCQRQRSYQRQLSYLSAFVIIAELWPEVARPGNYVSNFCIFWGDDPSQTVATARIAPNIGHGQPPHLAHIVPDFFQIGSLSALLPNARRPFLPRRVFTI